uniref:Large ribosomal subunit protein uL23m n=1 Tax=Oryzias melastigma TaxID=30732 RepID=A0A3B3CHV5_ORYME
MTMKNIFFPIYQLGNPQLRIFRPNWFLTLVRPGKEQPPDTVQFRVPMEMTKYDVKNYLEKIYNVPVGVIRTRIQFGSRPDLHFPRPLPREDPGPRRGLHGGDAGQVHGGRKAAAETGPQERGGHRVVWAVMSVGCRCGRSTGAQVYPDTFSVFSWLWPGEQIQNQRRVDQLQPPLKPDSPSDLDPSFTAETN